MILLNYGIDKDGRSCNDQILSDLKCVKDFGAVPLALPVWPFM